MMKKLLLVLLFVSNIAVAQQACVTNTVVVNGKLVVCTICPGFTVCS
jgi:hypothetical protein